MTNLKLLNANNHPLLTLFQLMIDNNNINVFYKFKQMD